MNSHRRRRLQKTVQAITGLAVMGLVAVACSSSGSATGQGAGDRTGVSPSGNTAPVSSGSTAPAEASLQKVKIALPVFNITDVPLLIAQKNAIFEKHGLSVDNETLSGSGTAIAALTSGSIPFALVSGTAFAVSTAKGVPLLSVAALLDGSPGQMVVSTHYLKTHPDTAKLVDEHSTDIKAIMHSLQGAKYSYVSIEGESMVKYMAAAGDVDPTSMDGVKVQSDDAGFAALKSGQLDLALSSPPQTYEAVEQGYAKVVVNTPPDWTGLPYFDLITTPKYAKSHGDIVSKLVASFVEATAFVSNNAGEAIGLVKDQFPDISEAVLKESVQAAPWSKDGSQTADGWAKLLRLSKITGDLPQNQPDIPANSWSDQYLPSK